MEQKKIQPTGREVKFSEDEIIVSKTDLRGIMTYVNETFLKVSGYTEVEMLGKPHNVIRSPEMPRSVFKLLWDRVEEQKEIFAYVVNLAKNGDHYWVFAHVTPSYDSKGHHVGYHSNRRVPYPDALPKVKELYQLLCAEERKHSDAKSATQAGVKKLGELLQAQGLDYDRFVFQLSKYTTLEASV